jgi:hypothetical protein
MAHHGLETVANCFSFTAGATNCLLPYHRKQAFLYKIKLMPSSVTMILGFFFEFINFILSGEMKC